MISPACSIVEPTLASRAVFYVDDHLIGTAVAALWLEIIASGGTLRAADVIEDCLSG
jgi:hypothetical protein